MPRHSLYALISLNFCILSFNISVLSLELLCITFFSCLIFFALAKLNYFYPFWKDLISKFICYRLSFSLFALFKSVRVLKFIIFLLFGFQ